MAIGNNLSLRARLKSAETTLTVASASFDIWWVYKGIDTRDLETMNELPTFFRFDEEAHFRTMIVGLYTLYDSHRRTITIKSLIEELDAQAAKPIWRKYRSVHDAVKKVRHLRHNVVAHRNAASSYDDIFREAGLTPDDLRRLIADSLTLLTLVANSIGASIPVMSPFLTGETRELLDIIKRSKR